MARDRSQRPSGRTERLPAASRNGFPFPGLSLVLVSGAERSWSDPGFTGEPVAEGERGQAIDVFVACGSSEGRGAKLAQVLAEAGIPGVAIAPEEDRGLEPHRSVGSPFAIPEPALLAPRHFPRSVLDGHAAYFRVVEGLPDCYVLVERSVLSTDDGAVPADLELALRRLAEGAWRRARAEVVWLSPGSLAEDPQLESTLRERRAETEEGRYQPEDWPGHPWRHKPELRVTNPLDVAAAVEHRRGAGSQWGADGLGMGARCPPCRPRHGGERPQCLRRLDR